MRERGNEKRGRGEVEKKKGRRRVKGRRRADKREMEKREGRES